MVDAAGAAFPAVLLPEAPPVVAVPLEAVVAEGVLGGTMTIENNINTSRVRRPIMVFLLKIDNAWSLIVVLLVMPSAVKLSSGTVMLRVSRKETVLLCSVILAKKLGTSTDFVLEGTASSK